MSNRLKSGLCQGIAAAVITAAVFEAARAPPRSGPLQLEPSTRAPGPAPLELAGCQVVFAGPSGASPSTCEVPRDGAIRVWVDAAPGDAVTIRSSGEGAREREPRPDRGRLFDVRVRPEAPWLRVEATRAAGSFAATPPLAAARAPDEIDALIARRTSDAAAVEQRAARLLDGDDAVARARATGLIARMRRDRGDLLQARALFERAIERDREAGRISDLYADTFALAYTLGVQMRELDAARAALAGLAPLSESGLASPQHEAQARYYEALIAHEAGDLGAALEGYRASRERAARLGDEAHVAGVLSQEALVLAALGRAAEVAALYEAAAPLFAGLRPCDRARVYNNWSDLLLHALEASPDVELPDPAGPLARAIELVRGECPRREERAIVALSLAQVSLRRGDTSAARAAIAEASELASGPGKRDAAELADVEAEVARAEGDLKGASAAYDRLADIAQGALLPYYRRRAALGRAELLERSGDAEAARRAYEELEQLIADDSLLAPLGEGRLGFLEQLARGPERYVAFLLERPGGEALAAAVARRSIAHMLASLGTVEHIHRLPSEERRSWESALAAYRGERARLEAASRDEWMLPAEDRAREREGRRAAEERARRELDLALAAVQRSSGAGRQLAPPGPGELFLSYHRLSDAAWAGFAIEESGVTARQIDAEGLPRDSSLPGSAAILSERLLSPFAAQIERARSVRLLVPRGLRAVEFHALPFGEATLIERAPITYGLDVRGPEVQKDAAPGALALIVAAPQGGLPEARSEGEAVGEALRRGGLDVTLLSAQDGERAAYEQVRGLLEREDVGVFHFAGHAQFSGADGWDSEIPLAENGALRVGDVFALRRVPRLVVLSGCETGRSDGLGLAHAFVAAGARAAVGVTRVIPDRDAGLVMRRFYEHLRRDAPAGEAAARAMRAVAMEMLRDGAGDAWKSFRVFVP